MSFAGHQMVQARNEVEALSIAKSQRVDLAMLYLPVDETIDMDLPNVLRDVSFAEYLPVVILAENLAEQHRCRFLDSGADDVISNDLSIEEIDARIGALLRVKDLNDQLASSRAALQDALERERELLVKLRSDNERLHALATTDPLTRVQNVRSFRDILNHEFKVAKRYGKPLSMLMLDVDHFKVVNDTHGHPSGDYVLKELAVILTQSVRESDVVARTGGEEFGVLLPRADREKAMSFAERIREEVYGRQFLVYDQDIHVTISIGVATFPEDAEITDPELVVYFSDQALLAAKDQGRDRVVAFHELSRSVRRRLRRQYLNMQRVQVEEKICVPEIQGVEAD